jgi:hypothetical protein
MIQICKNKMKFKIFKLNFFDDMKELKLLLKIIKVKIIKILLKQVNYTIL